MKIKPFKNINIDRFFLSIGWYENEDPVVFRLDIMDFIIMKNSYCITIFGIRIFKFVFLFGISDM